MKKLLNSPDRLVAESVEGYVLAHPDLLVRHADPLFVTAAAPVAPGRVAVISGGGSGHEPLHLGFVGAGMLAAAVPGELFTSPAPDAFRAAALEVERGGGVLAIVADYAGDRMNAEIAGELLATDELDFRIVLVGDDVAVPVGAPRGLAGVVVVERIAGAAAASGADLETVERIARTVAARTRSMGLAFGAPTVPHTGTPSFDLGEGEIELGVGIHAELGAERAALRPAAELVELLTDRVTAGIAPGSELLVVVNGLGGTTLAELSIAYREVEAALARRGLTVGRRLVGDFVTALEMPGLSLTVTPLDSELVALWDSPVRTGALRWP